MAALSVQTGWLGSARRWGQTLMRISMGRMPTAPTARSSESLAPAISVTASAENDQGLDRLKWNWAEWIFGRDITESFMLMAVPKKRTTHSKKRKRMTHKYLSRRISMVSCEFCGDWKRPHTYCTLKCPGRRGRSGPLVA